jgi:hypothetical protein
VIAVTVHGDHAWMLDPKVNEDGAMRRHRAVRVLLRKPAP